MKNVEPLLFLVRFSTFCCVWPSAVVSLPNASRVKRGNRASRGGVGGKNIWSFDEASFFRLLLLSSCDTREDTLVSIRASPPTRGSDGRICICRARWNLQDFLFLSPNQNHNLLRASFPNRNSTSRKIHVAESESGDGFTSLSAQTTSSQSAQSIFNHKKPVMKRLFKFKCTHQC